LSIILCCLYVVGGHKWQRHQSKKECNPIPIDKSFWVITMKCSFGCATLNITAIEEGETDRHYTKL
ncbi:unnamed protein product, partial [Musa textilis]